jgi:hypothetical protein
VLDWNPAAISDRQQALTSLDPVTHAVPTGFMVPGEGRPYAALARLGVEVTAFDREARDTVMR